MIPFGVKVRTDLIADCASARDKRTECSLRSEGILPEMAKKEVEPVLIGPRAETLQSKGRASFETRPPPAIGITIRAVGSCAHMSRAVQQTSRKIWPMGHASASPTGRASTELQGLTLRRRWWM